MSSPGISGRPWVTIGDGSFLLLLLLFSETRSQAGLELTIQQRITLNSSSSCLHLLITGFCCGLFGCPPWTVRTQVSPGFMLFSFLSLKSTWGEQGVRRCWGFGERGRRLFPQELVRSPTKRERGHHSVS